MYTDLLVRIKNAQAIKKENIRTPYSKMDEVIISILQKNGYIESYERKGRGPKKVLDVKLKYQDDKGSISGVKFLSRPSRKIYLGYKEIRPVRHGFGLMVISTPKGVMTGRDARKIKVGGEALFEIW